MVSKFQPCLPEDAEDRLLAERLLDLAGALHFLGTTKVAELQPIARPTGARLGDFDAGGPRPLELRLPARAGELASPRNPVEWVDTPAALRAVVEKLVAEDTLGLDVETTLDFGTLCLVQIATHARTYLVDPFAVGGFEPLRGVLSARKPLKVIHNAMFERRALAAVGIALGGVFDTLEASRRLRGKDAFGGHGLSMVCERELGHAIDKTEQTSNWSRRPLTPEQLQYAALDAEVLLALHARFARELPATAERFDAES